MKTQQQIDAEEEESIPQKITGQEFNGRKILCVNQPRGGATKYVVVTDRGPSIPVSNIRQFAKEHRLSYK